MKATIPEIVSQFDRMPDQAVIDLSSAVIISGRSRASLYRHFRAGELNLVKIGNSTRVRVADIRHLIGA